MLVDVHCHLTDSKIYGKIDDVIKDAINNDVKIIVTSTLTIEDISKAINIANKFRGIVYITIGFDPANLSIKDLDYLMSLVKKIRDFKYFVGIGEIGLDFIKIRDKTLKEISIVLLTKLLNLVKELNVPVVIHCRKAMNIVLNKLREFKIDKVVFHAYNDSLSYVKECVEYGYYFSIPPSIMYSKQKQELVKQVPLENLLLESDAPIIGLRKGEESRPSDIKFVVEKIAEIKGESINRVKDITTNNAFKVFQFKLS